MSSASALSRASRFDSSAFSIVASERLMMSTRGCTPPRVSRESRVAKAPDRARRAPATIDTASCDAVPIVAIACATSVRAGSDSSASTAAARSTGRWASTRAIVCGSSPSTTLAIWAGSTAVRKSNDDPVIADDTRVSTPAARSEPNDASSSPVARSRPPRAGGRCPCATRWKSVSAELVVSASRSRSRMISAAITSASSSPRCFITSTASARSRFIMTTAAV